jgi:hypothetical protein
VPARKNSFFSGNENMEPLLQGEDDYLAVPSDITIRSADNMVGVVTFLLPDK